MYGLSSLIDFAAAGTLGRDSHLLSPWRGERGPAWRRVVTLAPLSRLAQTSEYDGEQDPDDDGGSRPSGLGRRPAANANWVAPSQFACSVSILKLEKQNSRFHAAEETTAVNWSCSTVRIGMRIELEIAPVAPPDRDLPVCVQAMSDGTQGAPFWLSEPQVQWLRLGPL